MKNTLTILSAGLVLGTIVVSCAKEQNTSVNDSTKRGMEAWITINYPDAPQTPLGSYILEDIPGSGALIGDSKNAPYLYGSYTQRGLDGTISYTADRDLAKQLGTFDTTAYYGNSIWARIDTTQTVGVDEVLSTMRVGGTRTVAIPSWLLTYTRYKDPSDYINHKSKYSNSIFTIHIDEIVPDVTKWEIDSIERYVHRHYPGVDSTEYGYYYIQTKAPDNDSTFVNEEKVYLNYIGRRLDGQVFDCTIRDTARKYNTFVSSRTYEPTYMNWNTESFSKLTMGSNKTATIPGFSKAVFGMHAGEKGVVIMGSGYGYGATGSGNMIPEYSPIMFELEMLGAKESD